MNRQPVYHEQTKTLRVISVPNGLWMAQKHIGADRPNPWDNVSRHTSQDEALRRIHSLQPLKR